MNVKITEYVNKPRKAAVPCDWFGTEPPFAIETTAYVAKARKAAVPCTCI